jgi:hypothetical protein
MPFPICQDDGIHSFKKLSTFVTTVRISPTPLGFAEQMMLLSFCVTSSSYVTIDSGQIFIDPLTVMREPLPNKRLHTKRFYKLSVMMQTSSPSGEAQAVLTLTFWIVAVVLNVSMSIQHQDNLPLNPLHLSKSRLSSAATFHGLRPLNGAAITTS